MESHRFKALAKLGTDRIIQPMRTAIFADTHGNRTLLRSAVAAHLPLDRIVHLGDGITDADTAASEFGLPIQAVAGNEDGASLMPEEIVIDLCGVPALALHGHRLDLNPYHGEEAREEHYHVMARLGSDAGARIVLFGHTHRPLLIRRSGMVLLNPGNLYPGSHEYSFAIACGKEDCLHLVLLRTVDGKSWKEYIKLGVDFK